MSKSSKITEIRNILADFDWETDDRQIALERIERIVSVPDTATVTYAACEMTHPKYGCFGNVYVNGQTFAHLYGSTEGHENVDITFMVRDCQFLNRAPFFTSCEFTGVTVNRLRVHDVCSKLALILA